MCGCSYLHNSVSPLLRHVVAVALLVGLLHRLPLEHLQTLRSETLKIHMVQDSPVLSK